MMNDIELYICPTSDLEKLLKYFSTLFFSLLSVEFIVAQCSLIIETSLQLLVWLYEYEASSETGVRGNER